MWMILTRENLVEYRRRGREKMDYLNRTNKKLKTKFKTI